MAKDTATQLLDTAQDLVQERGYNAFSYKDLAEAVGIRTASIHYHFPSKSDLALALMERYHAGLEGALGELERRGKTEKSRLRSFIQLYQETEARGAICLCGSLASDLETLDEPVQDAVKAYLDTSEKWVARRITNGVREGEFDFGGKASEAAATLLAGLQGGLLVSRARGKSVLDHVQRTFFLGIGA